MMIKLLRHCNEKSAATDRQSLKWWNHSFTLDGLVHCKTEQQAQHLLDELKRRFKACGLELHPDKTKIVYCKDNSRKRDYPNKTFDFLGYTFRARLCKNNKRNTMFIERIAKKQPWLFAHWRVGMIGAFA